jgi:hypothetical protein
MQLRPQEVQFTLQYNGRRNKMINSTFKPTHKSQFNSSNVNFNGLSCFGSCAPSATATADLSLADDHFITGGIFIVKNGKFGDKVSLQVVHPTLGVVNQFVTDYGIIGDSQLQFTMDEDYPAKIPAGLKLRILYVATSELLTREFCLNYTLHKVLY